MDLGIAGKRAVVIGGSSGLGLAACEALAAEGVDLLLFARNPTTLGEACLSLSRRFDVAADFVAGDLTIRADARTLAERSRQLGRAQILVLNTPRPPSPMRAFLEEDDDERWEEAYRDQLKGALNILREMAPVVASGDWGRIIGITSASVKQPMPRHSISTIFRSGVQAALKHLSSELAPGGVTVNSVAPATVLTGTFSTFHNLEERIAATPVRRHGTPEELGATVAFLASKHAGFITGEVIQFDGGLTRSLV